MKDATAWMPMYVSDFLMGTLGWDADVVGHYIRLICINWDRGSIPEDVDEWDKLSAGSSAHSDKLIDKFPVIRSGQRCNPRVAIEKEKALARYNRRCEAGQKGAKARWGGGDSSPPSVSSTEGRPPANAPVVTDRGSRDARRAWGHVPIFRQQGWRLFLRKWEEVVVRQMLDVEKIVESFRDYYASPQGRGKFCRGAIKLLEAEVWEESVEAWKSGNEETVEESMSLLDDVIGGKA